MVTVLLSSSTGTLAGHDGEEGWSNVSPQLPKHCYATWQPYGLERRLLSGSKHCWLFGTAQSLGYQGSFSIPVQGFS